MKSNLFSTATVLYEQDSQEEKFIYKYDKEALPNKEQPVRCHETQSPHRLNKIR